jgi:signal transduction histidine kinase/nitrate/nitrite-specific signal transduction histidine kinase
MSDRPKQRSSLARRAFLTAFAGILVLLGGLGGLAYWAYLVLDALLAPLLGAQPWLVVQNVVIGLALDLAPYAGALLFGTLLLIWLLSRWAVRPIRQLVAATLGLDQGAGPTRLPLRATGEAGQLARSFDDLSQSLQRSALEMEAQNRSLTDTVRQLEGLLRIGRELNTTLDADQLVWRFAATLRAAFGYESAGVALVDGETLLYHFSGNTGGSTSAPPTRAPLTKNSVAGRVALTGTQLRIDDLRVEQSLDAAPGLPSARSELGAPVSGNDQILAVIVLQSSRPGAFGPSDEQQLANLSGPLAVALANTILFQIEQLRRQLAEAIYRVSQTLSAALAPDGVPELILDQLAQVLPYDRSALLVIDNDRVEVTAMRGVSGQPARTRMRIEDLPLIAQIVEQGQPIILDDTARDSRYRQIVGATPARSWLGVPLVGQGRVCGVLMLESNQPNHYSADELQAIAALGNQAAIAMENARLYAEAQERTLQLEVVTRVTQEVSTRDVGRELPGILRTIIHQIRRVVPCDYAALALYNEDDDTFSFETVYDFAVREWSDLPDGKRVSAENTSWQTSCRTGTALVQTELVRSTFAYDRGLAAGGLRSGVVVPIVGANRAIGTLDFASREPGAYGQTQVSTLRELSHYLGTALHNARLSQEREETATKLARTQEHLNLVDKVRAVGQLASGVAHDFNNLLAGILGNAQLLLFEAESDDQREMLRVIERAAKDGAETVRRLQGFARMEHDSPMTEVRLDMLARDAIDITRPRWRDVAQSRGASIEIVKQLGVVTPLAGRPAELREVLTNLIINAVDAMPKGGKITVATYDDRVAGNGAREHLSGPGQSVVVEIADTGTGMPAEVRARIFDPFFTTKGEQGTGLGLAVSLGIVQSHGGQIDVESAPGQGTRFVIRLPVRVADQNGKYPRPGKPATITPGHLLFVESEAMIRDATVRLLSRWGHKVAQAENGAEALAMFVPDTYDLVISDLGMPDMNGWDLLHEIKARDPRVPTVLITGWGRQFSDEEARARGVDFVIEKPFDQDDLRALLAEALGGR